MPALSVAAEEEDFVLDIARRVPVQLLDLMVKAFPLCMGLCALEIAISRVGAVNQTEVKFGL